jgi:hypothetical protein
MQPAPDARAATAMGFAVLQDKIAQRAEIKVLHRTSTGGSGGVSDTFQRWHFPEIYPSRHDLIALPAMMNMKSGANTRDLGVLSTRTSMSKR